METLPGLIGDHHLLDDAFPVPGDVLLALDAARRPTLVSMGADPAAVLLAGLRAADMVAQQEPWLYRLYPALREAVLPARLIALAPQSPPGARTWLAALADVMIYTFRVVQVKGEYGLLLDKIRVAANHERRAAPVALKPSPPAGVLSEDEAAFFDGT